jgi:hypothetical protein
LIFSDIDDEMRVKFLKAKERQHVIDKIENHMPLHNSVTGFVVIDLINFMKIKLIMR